ncbi:MAG: hypothetical protein K2Q01_04340 [Rickettsiales bacterium]|nr:hypothetical protein [Rickettsiales bacterium]
MPFQDRDSSTVTRFFSILFSMVILPSLSGCSWWWWHNYDHVPAFVTSHVSCVDISQAPLREKIRQKYETRDNREFIYPWPFNVVELEELASDGNTLGMLVYGDFVVTRFMDGYRREGAYNLVEDESGYASNVITGLSYIAIVAAKPSVYHDRAAYILQAFEKHEVPYVYTWVMSPIQKDKLARFIQPVWVESAKANAESWINACSEDKLVGPM